MRLTMRARGRLDSLRQIGFIAALGFIRFVGESMSLQPPVTRAVSPQSPQHRSIVLQENKETKT